MIAAVIPTLDAARHLPRLLAALSAANAAKATADAGRVALVVVSDGGSRDRTAALAGEAGAQVVFSPKGRGLQLAAGADAAIAAGADWLLFVHADSVPGAGWRGFDPSIGLAVGDRHIALAAAPDAAGAAAISGRFGAPVAGSRLTAEVMFV